MTARHIWVMLGCNKIICTKTDREGKSHVSSEMYQQWLVKCQCVKSYLELSIFHYVVFSVSVSPFSSAFGTIWHCNCQL